MAIALDAEKMRAAKKIVFAGLDNGGKTTINNALSENPVSIGFTKPTYLVRRDMFQFLDHDIISCDMGGQKSYIISYFKEPGRYFSETDALIFVIDVQDGDRIIDATQYFKDILQQFNNVRIRPGIFVFFHKAERILQGTNTEDTANMNETRRIIVNINKDSFPLEFFTTTILVPWTISTAFASVMKYLHPLDESVGVLLNDLATSLNLMVAVLMDQHMIPVMESVHAKEIDDLINNAAPNLFTLKSALDKIEVKPTKLASFAWGTYDFILATTTESQAPLHVLLIGVHDAINHDMLEQGISSFLEELATHLYFK
jgi:GTPase SAR1 family protein